MKAGRLIGAVRWVGSVGVVEVVGVGSSLIVVRFHRTLGFILGVVGRNRSGSLNRMKLGEVEKGGG